MTVDEKRAAHTEYMRGWRDRNREKVRATHREEQRRYEARNRVKVRARDAVYRALVDGRLVRQPCERCGVIPAAAHHGRGYTGDAVLDVTWLCPVHHGEEHRAE